MAEMESTTALVKSDSAPLGNLTVKEFDASGKSHELTFPLPATQEFALWSLEQQIGMLKQFVWKKIGIPEILWGLAYAHKIDADPVKGEIFPLGDGRWGTSNKYKIRKALETGRIEGIETSIQKLNEPIDLEKAPNLKTDIACTVTIHVKGWKKPIVRTARLSRWYKASNPNWRDNPEHMLELNTVAHACEYIVPGATEDDEFLDTPAVEVAKVDLQSLKSPYLDLAKKGEE